MHWQSPHSSDTELEPRVPILMLLCTLEKNKCTVNLHVLYFDSLFNRPRLRGVWSPVTGGWNTMDPTGALDTEDELGPLAHLAPSPQSEAVAHEFQELSLQSSQYLPPLHERKNGEFSDTSGGDLVLQTCLFVSPVYSSLVVIFMPVTSGRLPWRRQPHRGPGWC